MRLTSISRAVLVVVFFVAGSAQAACVVPAFGTPLADQLALLPECQRSAAYLSQIGRLFNAQGRYVDALDHLERALMFDPDQVGTKLDYAIALAGSGDMLSAGQLLDTIIAEPELPATMRLTLAQAKQRLMSQAILPPPATVDDAPYLFQLTAGLRAGHDSNLLGSPNLSELTLTFPGEVVVLPLADSNNPRPGAYKRYEVKLEFGYRRDNSDRWDFTANLAQRRSAAVPESDTQQSELAIEYNPSLANGWSPYGTASGVNLTSTGGTQYASHGVSVGLQSAAIATESRGICSARMGAEWQDRHLGSNPILSGRYSGLSALWSCTSASGGHWQLNAKAGHDIPVQDDRPGGNQAVASVRAAASTNTWFVDIELSRAQDSTGYSPLLDDNATRQTTRVSARLEYQQPLGARLVGTLGAEWASQISNLPLFRVQNWGPYAALRYTW